MAVNHDDKNLALYCDFENIALGVRDARYKKFNIGLILERLLVKGSIVVKKAYCDWDRYKEFKGPMHEASFELIEIPHVRMSGKNSADIRMVVDALDLCYTKLHVDTFVIISGDSDFSPLVSKLRENAKTVIGVGVKNSTSDLLISNCDEFIYYDDLVRETENKGSSSRRRGRKRPQRDDEADVPAGQDAREDAREGGSRPAREPRDHRRHDADAAPAAPADEPSLADAGAANEIEAFADGEEAKESTRGGRSRRPRRPRPGGHDGTNGHGGTNGQDGTHGQDGQDDTNGQGPRGGREGARDKGVDTGRDSRDEDATVAKGPSGGDGIGVGDRKESRGKRRERGGAGPSAPARDVPPSEAAPAAAKPGRQYDEDDFDEEGGASVDFGPVDRNSDDAAPEALHDAAPGLGTDDAEGVEVSFGSDDADDADGSGDDTGNDSGDDSGDDDEGGEATTGRSGGKSEEQLRQEGLDIVYETTAAMLSERGGKDKLWGSMIKQTLKRRRPGFNESYYGFDSFSKMLEEAETQGMMSLELDDRSGGYIIREISD